MRRILLTLTALALLMTACGTNGELDQAIDAAAAAGAASQNDADESSGLAAASAPDPNAITAEATGNLPINSIRIGDQIWQRTLPMTTGQCFVTGENENGNGLPASTNVWGTLNGDPDVKFSASMSQSGELSALVDDQQTFHWLAGARATNLSEVEMAFDIENDIVTGSGIFWNAFTSERAYGSFAFQCEPTS